MSTPVVYPISLPGPSSWSGSPLERRAASGLPGLTGLRARSRDSLRDIEAGWFYTAAEMEVWLSWYENDLLNGQLWFAATAPGAATAPRVLKFRTRTLKKEAVGNGHFRVSAQLQQRGVAVPPVVPELAGAWWDFSETTGTTYLDRVAGHHLTIEGATAADMSVGGVNGAAHYRGGETQDARLIYVPRSDTGLDFGPTQSFSIGAWTNRRSLMNTLGLLTRVIMGRNGGGTGASAYDLTYWNADGTVRFSIVDAGGTVRATASVATPATTWCLVVGVCDVDAAEIVVFVNETQSAATALPSGGARSVDSSNFCIGHPLANDSVTGTQISQRQADAYFDSAFACPNALTPADVSWLYNAGAGRSYTEARVRGLFTV